LSVPPHPGIPLRRTFPPTRHSVFESLGDRDETLRRAAADVLVRAYWGPVAALLELRWHLDRADAEDMTQDFFAEAVAKEWFSRYDASRGRFRTFLRTCVDRFAANAVKARQRLKRGGGVANEPIEMADVAGAHAPDETDARIHDEWVRGILSIALDAMRSESVAKGTDVQMAIFEAYDVDDPPDDKRPTYRALAIRFGVPETQVTNYLAWARREFRKHVLAAVRSLAANDDEFREDARDLLGARPS
jgi:DNA-directed RNA polymerase specialized sigma24 family protein